MQIICTSLQTANYASSITVVVIGWMLFRNIGLTPSQQCQSNIFVNIIFYYYYYYYYVWFLFSNISFYVSGK